MGSTIGRIEKEFVLNSVCDNSVPLKISAYKLRESGQLKTIEDDYLVISGDAGIYELFPAGSEIRVYFSYYGHVMTFVTTVRGEIEGDLKTDIPPSIHKNLARKYERVEAPTGVEVSFEIQEAKIELNFPKSEEYNPVEPPDISSEYDPSNMQSLIRAFRERTAHKASVNSVTMFRGRPPAGLEETLISQTGKIFFIPDTSGRFPENDFEMGGRIITRAMLLRQERVSAHEEESQDKLPELLAGKRAKGILAEIYCPIVYHEYTVGFIYLAQTEQKEGAFDHDLLDETDQFAKILAYALKLSGYFQEQIPETNTFTGDIIDISASGLLFANGSDKLESTLLLYTDIDLQLKFGPRLMRVGGRVMRRLAGEGMNYFGIQFMDIKPEDFRFLFDFVYGRPMTAEDEDLWEGGADPPALDLD